MLHSMEYLVPDWPAPAKVRSVSTLRRGGVSAGPYGDVDSQGRQIGGGLNLGDHVGDAAECVAENRRRLAACLPSEPHWLKQVHGTVVHRVEYAEQHPPCADASVSTHTQQVCVVLTADCLPVLLCDTQARGVAAAHAGWRGLCDGVLEQTVQTLRRALGQVDARLLAWLGPAIGPMAFEVGEDVRQAFLSAALPEERGATEQAFQPYQRRQTEVIFQTASNSPGYLADLPALARLRLRRVGVHGVFGGTRCTVREPHYFYSYRRDGVTGRMASLIWLQDETESVGVT